MRSHPSSTPHNHTQKTVIGWRETAGLPDWGIRSIKTKIDTGARTSALHVDNIDLTEAGKVRFDVIVDPASCHSESGARVSVESDLVRMSKVRTTSGQHSPRPVVRTRLVLGTIEREVEISLVSRHGMLCRLLVGRTALKGAFLVDPSTMRAFSKSRSHSQRADA